MPQTVTLTRPQAELLARTGERAFLDGARAAVAAISAALTTYGEYASTELPWESTGLELIELDGDDRYVAVRGADGDAFADAQVWLIRSATAEQVAAVRDAGYTVAAELVPAILAVDPVPGEPYDDGPYTVDPDRFEAALLRQRAELALPLTAFRED